jgi:hypothetical protein
MNEKEFISSKASKLASAGIKNFPQDFLEFKEYKEVRLPAKTLLIGKEFFGKYEILTPAGDSVLHTDNYIQAKFIIYSNRNTPGLLHIPSNEAELKSGIKKYESYLDDIIRNIESDYEKAFPEEVNSKNVVNEVFKLLNLVRI